MLKLYKISDRTIFKIFFVLLVLFNLKYLFLIFQIPYTVAFVDYMHQNEFYSEVQAVENSIKEIADFYDEGKIGFVSDVNQSAVFDKQDSVKAFYITQYAITPSVLKNDTGSTYVIGIFNRKWEIPENFEIYKKINERTYIFKRKK